MPEPVPEWLRRLSVAEMQKDLGPKWTIARMIWERGDVEPVDPLLIEARKLFNGRHPSDDENAAMVIKGEWDDRPVIQSILAALKRGMELAKEIG